MKILAKGSFPFAVYRLPGEDTVKVLIDRSEDLHVVENANADRGFVFAPFALGLPLTKRTFITNSLCFW